MLFRSSIGGLSAPKYARIISYPGGLNDDNDGDGLTMTITLAIRVAPMKDDTGGLRSLRHDS